MQKTTLQLPQGLLIGIVMIWIRRVPLDAITMALAAELSNEDLAQPVSYTNYRLRAKTNEREHGRA
jgi:hypothetical protein